MNRNLYFMNEMSAECFCRDNSSPWRIPVTNYTKVTIPVRTIICSCCCHRNLILPLSSILCVHLYHTEKSNIQGNKHNEVVMLRNCVIDTITLSICPMHISI